MTNLIDCIDQDLVPKPADEVEAEVHERPGGVGPAVLLLPGGPRPSAHGTRGQALVSRQCDNATT